MDQTGSLVDTNLRIYPSETLIAFIETIPISDDIPLNILRYIKHDIKVSKKDETEKVNFSQVQLTNDDIIILNRIKEATANLNTNNVKNADNIRKEFVDDPNCNFHCEKNEKEISDENDNSNETEPVEGDSKECIDELYLTTSDIDWVYTHINVRKSEGDENVPYLHELLQGADIVMPKNRVIKRNPILEARCVKLRAQQEAREYRKMTKGVDNVRMRFPEDSISYQLKQVNRHLIAIGQFIISIFAGFLFGFRGVEWMVGNLDFGVRLLLGVMCALIIALAEIYFLAKKLNEELTMTETIQLGGPPKFPNQPDCRKTNSITTDNKEHQD